MTNARTQRRITITQTRFEKSATTRLEISGILGNLNMSLKDQQKAVVRISQIGDQFTVYVKIFSEMKKTFRELKYYDTLTEATKSANKYGAILIEHGFEVVAIK